MDDDRLVAEQFRQNRILYDPMYKACQGSWHVSRGNERSCFCGRKPNPAHRSWWQRVRDKGEMRKRHGLRWWQW